MSPKFFHITTWSGYSIPSRLQFFNKISCQKFTSAITVADATTIHIFGYSTISKSLPINLIKNFIKFSQHHEYKFYNFRIGKVGELYWSEYFMQICFDHEIIVKTTGGYASSMNGKVEHNTQTINNTVHIKNTPTCAQQWPMMFLLPINHISHLLPNQHVTWNAPNFFLVTKPRTSITIPLFQNLSYGDDNFTS